MDVVGGGIQVDGGGVKPAVQESGCQGGFSYYPIGGAIMVQVDGGGVKPAVVERVNASERVQ